MARPAKPWTEKFNDRLAELLADATQDQAAFARSHERSQRLLGVCQQADGFAADVAAGALDRLRGAAADARLESRIEMNREHPGRGGRPIKREPEFKLEQFLTKLSDSKEDAAAAIRKLDATVPRLLEVAKLGPVLDDLAERQQAAVKTMLDRLDEAVEAATLGFDLYDRWTQIAKDVSDVAVPTVRAVVAPSGPGDIAERGLVAGLAKSLRSHFDRERGRIGAEVVHSQGGLTDADKRREAQADMEAYQAALRKAATAYRKTKQGKRDWASIGEIHSRMSGPAANPLSEAGQAAMETIEQARSSWWFTVAGYSGITFDEARLPHGFGT